jgi:cysteinyl-tRNA synthetase
MAYELLGARFDIHGGGNDLQFPHHENEIAQSKCCGHGFANVWMHNEMLQVEGKKMSKSLGNFFTVRDLLDGNWSGGWKVPGEVIRFVFLSTHYRKPMDWTERKAEDASKVLRRWQALVDRSPISYAGIGPNVDPIDGVVQALKDDLNTSLALKLLVDFEKQRLRAETVDLSDLSSFLRTIQILGLHGATNDSTELPEDIKAALEDRLNVARSEKRFDESDALRARILEAGYDVLIGKSGAIIRETNQADPAKLEALK